MFSEIKLHISIRAVTSSGDEYNGDDVLNCMGSVMEPSATFRILPSVCKEAPLLLKWILNNRELRIQCLLASRKVFMAGSSFIPSLHRDFEAQMVVFRQDLSTLAVRLSSVKFLSGTALFGHLLMEYCWYTLAGRNCDATFLRINYVSDSNIV